MAARENQGYLIAVIILVLLVLVLALLTFLGWSKANEYSEGMTNAQSELSVEKKIREAHQIEAEIMRSLIGDLGDSTAEVPTKIESVGRLAAGNLSDAQKSAIQNVVLRVDEVKKAYDRDMQQFISRTEDDQSEELTWSGVMRNLIAVTSRKHNELSVKRQENENEKARLESEKEALSQRLNANEQQLAKSLDDLKKEQQRNGEKEAELIAKFEKAQQTLAANARENSNQVKQLQSKVGELDAFNRELENSNANLKNRIAVLTQENFDLHDGTIVQVGRRSGLVYLDIGSADGLRTNQTFAVYDRNINNFEINQEKAKIEVVRITGPHTADARVTEEDPTNPITKLDLVVTPTWDPGYSVPIALAGVFDLDKDGNSDRLQFIRMIENNGGTVVAQHDEEGKILGKIDSSTRYLVMGDTPPTGPDGGNGSLFNAIRELRKQAEDQTVQVIDLRQMLNRMGRHLAQVEKFNPGLDQFRRRPISNTPAATSDDPLSEGSSTR